MPLVVAQIDPSGFADAIRKPGWRIRGGPNVLTDFKVPAINLSLTDAVNAGCRFWRGSDAESSEIIQPTGDAQERRADFVRVASGLGGTFFGTPR